MNINSSDKLSLVIQAGGESKRMGEPKACVEFLGEPLIMRTLRSLASVADEVLITTNVPESFSFLKEESYKVFAQPIRLEQDILDVRGALQGIYSALYHACYEYVAIVACDMIFPSKKLMLAELELLMERKADLVIPRTKHGFEPFHAIYRKDTCQKTVKAALDAGEVKANGWWYATLNAIELSMDDVRGIDNSGSIFLNTNTKEELRRIETLILNGL